MAPGAQAVIWGFLNLTMFWLGLFFLADRLGIFRARLSAAWLFTAALVASFELDGSLRYQQVNAMLAGLTMFSFGALLGAGRRGAARGSAGLLALAANLKIVPGFFFPPLLLGRSRWGLYFVAFALGFFALLPLLFWGPASAWDLSRSWLLLLQKDSAAPGLLDLGTYLLGWGWSAPGILLARAAVLLATWVLMALAARPEKWQAQADLVLGLGFCAILLLSPRSESPTFVLLSPAYFFFLLRLWPRSSVAPYDFSTGLRRLLFGWGLFLATLQYHDLWPRAWHPGAFHYKTLGTLTLWALFAWEILLSRTKPAAAV